MARLSSIRGDMSNCERETAVEKLVLEVENEGQFQSASLGLITGVGGQTSSSVHFNSPSSHSSSTSSIVSREKSRESSIPLLLGVGGIWR